MRILNGLYKQRLSDFHLSMWTAFLFLILLIPDSSAATERLEINNVQDNYRLLDYMQFWEENGQTLTIETVSDPANLHHFKPLKGHRTHFGFRPSALWARLQIHNSSSESLWFILLEDSASIRSADQIDLYKPNPKGGFYQYKDGENIPFGQTMIPEISVPSFWVYVTPGKTKTYYLRIQDEGLAYLPVILKNERALRELKSKGFMWFAVLGAFSFFLVYNLLLYATLKDRVFLYFSFMLAGIPLFIFVTQLNYFAPDLEFWWINRIKDSSLIFYRVAWLILTKNYFLLKEPDDKLNQWIKGLIIWEFILTTALFLLPYHWVAWISPVSSIAVWLSIALISIMAWYRGFAAGRYYIIAASLTFLQTCTRSMNELGLIFLSAYQNPMIRMSFFLVSLLFCALALIDRHNILSRQMLAAQKRSMESLKQSERAKDEFLANTSHELRTPLHGIIGLCENLLVRGKERLQTAWDQDLNIIVHSARRLSTLVEDILDFTRIRQGSIQLTIRPVDIESILKLTIAFCRPLIGEKKIQLQIKTSKDLPSVLADENRLQQILLNLIKNAIKFTQEGKIVISAIHQGAFLKINVQDTGIGIPENMQTEIFNRFVQIDGAIDRQYGGVGLGLAITRQLVELHKGKIAVKSVEGNGACFGFTIPIADKSAIMEHSPLPVLDTDIVNTMDTPAIVPPPNLPKTQCDNEGTYILIVDDEPVSLRALYNHLNTAGYQVYAAPEANTARTMIQANSFDLVILDIMMPHTNGYELCQELRQTFNPTELPVIMLTARTQPEDLLKGFECGANDYLTKPVNREELLTRIQTSLKLKSLTDLLRENKGLKAEIVRRRQAEYSLESANCQLAALLDLWESALILADGQNRVLYNNEQAEKLFGYPSYSLVNRSLRQVFPEAKEIIPKKDINIPFEAQDTNLMRNRHCQLTAHTCEGRTITVETLITPVTINNQTIWALVCHDIKEDIDKEKAISDEQAVQALAQHQKKINALQEAFGSALKYLDQEGRQLDDELAQIDQSIINKLKNMSQDTLEQHYRETLVTLMTETITCWTQITGTDKIALAEQSGIWRTYLDVSTYKTRTLDKYLKADKLPQNPRKKDVLKTVEFVTATCGKDHLAIKDLNASLTQFKAILKAKQFV